MVWFSHLHKILFLARESPSWSRCDLQSQTSLCLVFRQSPLFFEGTQLLEARTCSSGMPKKAPTVQGQRKVFKNWDPQKVNPSENAGFNLCDQEPFCLLTAVSIHLPVQQPEIMEMILVLAISYLGTTDFSGTLCLVIQAWTACSCSVLLS